MALSDETVTYGIVPFVLFLASFAIALIFRKLLPGKRDRNIVSFTSLSLAFICVVLMLLNASHDPQIQAHANDVHAPSGWLLWGLYAFVFIAVWTVAAIFSIVSLRIISRK